MTEKAQDKGRTVFIAMCAVIVVVGLIYEALTNPSRFQRTTSTYQSAAEPPPSLQPEQPQTSNEESRRHVDEYLQFLRETDKNGEMIIKAELGASPHTVNITVSNKWHYGIYQMRLQTARMLWKAWAGIHSPNAPDKAKIKILDMTGGEVGGSKFLGDVWVSDK